MTSDSSAEPRRTTRRRILYAVSGAAILVAAIVIGLSVYSNDNDGKADTPGHRSTPTASKGPSGAPKALETFTGHGDETTKTFSAAVNWELRWSTTPDPTFTVELFDKKGASLGRLVTAGKKTHGSVYVSAAGEYRLKVSGTQDWSIRIIGKSR